jgi:hypothetical protein
MTYTLNDAQRAFALKRIAEFRKLPGLAPEFRSDLVLARFVLNQFRAEILALSDTAQIDVRQN